MSQRAEFEDPNLKLNRGVIGVLTGGGDVPGLNPALRAITIRARYEGYQVIGIRRGWAGLVDMIREKDADNSNNFQSMIEERVRREARTGGTILHTSRTNPAKVTRDEVPPHLSSKYPDEKNDLTKEVLKNLDFLRVDYLIPIGGDDTLSYAVRLAKEGVKIIGIPKTMDNDVPGTDLCIGFSTCVSRTIELINRLRTPAGSHERYLVVEVFGRYAGFTAMEPTFAGAANRCVIPEVKVPIEQLAELMTADRARNPSHYSVAIISEGATFQGEDMVFQGHETDAYGHRKLGGIGELVSAKLESLSPQLNKGKKIGTITQNLGYLVRSGDPDALDSKIPVAFGNIAFDLIMQGAAGRLIVVSNGHYEERPIDIVTSSKKLVDVERYYNRERLRPHYTSYLGQPLFMMSAN